MGDEFVAAVEAGAGSILEAPRRWPVVRRRARRYLIARFPYGIICRVRRSAIEIVAVMHLSRDPEYWVRRLD